MQTDEHPNSKLVSTPALGLNCAQCKVNPPKARYEYPGTNPYCVSCGSYQVDLYPSPVASETPNPLGGDRNLDRPDLTTLGARERGTDDPVASESRVSKEHPVVREDIPELADDDEGYEVDEFEEEVIDEGFVWFKRLAQPEGNEGV